MSDAEFARVLAEARAMCDAYRTPPEFSTATLNAMRRSRV